MLCIRFLVESCRLVLAKGGSEWLLSLRENPSRQRVQEALMELPGIGRKVADCVALFSLDKSDVVPVDTHVWDIVVRDYEPSLGGAKSLTPAVYDQVGDTFRRVFPSCAGWAHSVLFAGELMEFRQYLPEEMQAEMDEFASQTKAKKSAAKEAKSELKKRAQLAAPFVTDSDDIDPSSDAVVCDPIEVKHREAVANKKKRTRRIKSPDQPGDHSS
jgi:N-glycosylase/DNA lyase